MTCFAATSPAMTCLGCARQDCFLEYSSAEYQVPGVDCLLTLAGASQNAVYDCPVPGTDLNLGCTTEDGGPQGIVASRTSQGTFRIFFEDIPGDPVATTLASWLGSNTFSYQLVCNNMTVATAANQTISRSCPD